MSKKAGITTPRARPPKLRVRMTEDGQMVPVSTEDSFQNLLTRTGVGAGNIGSAGNYGFNPITRNRLQVEWAYRGSWIVGTVVDCVAEDMTREGVEIQSDDKPEEITKLEDNIEEMAVWSGFQDAIKWARLYGGAGALFMVDGQDPETPLEVESVGKDQFRGVFPLDRWSLWPDLSNLVSEMGPDLGNPIFYDVRPDPGTGLQPMRIHHSRLIRLEGVRLPYWQRITENYWGMSVIERLWDRLIAFDSTTEGTAQLVYKSHLRTYKVEKLRDIIAFGGPALDSLVQQIAMIRKFQSNEGLTLMDAKDEFEIHPYSFGGLDAVLLQFGQQLSGASQIPLVRLFGQSPSGMNATGESDLRTYYDNIKRQQRSLLRRGVLKTYKLAYRSLFGKDASDAFHLEFKTLWQLNDQERAETGQRLTEAAMAPYAAGITGLATTLKELRQQSNTTGMWTNITDDDIDKAEKDDEAKANAPKPEDLGLLPAAMSQGAGRPGQPSLEFKAPEPKAEPVMRAVK